MPTKKIINLSATLEKVRAACWKYNEDNPTAEPLRDNHVHTAVWIYRLYTEKANKSGQLLKSKYFDSGAALAGCLKVHPKTIDNRMERLQAAEIAWKTKAVPSIRKKESKTSEFMISTKLLVIEEVESTHVQPLTISI